MHTRRHLLLSGCAALMAPAVARARAGDIGAAIRELPQLHSLQVLRGDDLVFAAAPRGPGIDRLANIKSVSKSIVAPTAAGAALGTVGEIPSVTTTLGPRSRRASCRRTRKAPGADGS